MPPLVKPPRDKSLSRLPAAYFSLIYLAISKMPLVAAYRIFTYICASKELAAIVMGWSMGPEDYFIAGALINDD